MCDPDGASVAAGDEIPEVDRGRFETLPCEAQLMIAGWRLDAPEFGAHGASFNDSEPAPQQHAPPPPTRYDGARELRLSLSARAEPWLADFPASDGLAPRHGHPRSVFRPPASLVSRAGGVGAGSLLPA